MIRYERGCGGGWVVVGGGGVMGPFGAIWRKQNYGESRCGAGFTSDRNNIIIVGRAYVGFLGKRAAFNASRTGGRQTICAMCGEKFATSIHVFANL